MRNRRPLATGLWWRRNGTSKWAEVVLLTRRERLRRVVILCASFARNVAFFRAGQGQTGSAVRAPSQPCSAFWTQISATFST
jgi:hypothetical protein